MSQVIFKLGQVSFELVETVLQLLNVIIALLVVQVVEIGFELLLLLSLDLNTLLLLLQSLRFFPQIVDRLLCLLPDFILLEVLLNFLEFVNLFIGATGE